MEPDGTGKSFLAVDHGAVLLRAGEVERLVVTRAAVEAGARLGFLPGDLTEKVDPYMAPVWEALTDILGGEAMRRRRDRGEIEVAPIAFMRGRTLSHAFVIVDEAQNTSRLQMKMVLTRLGEGSRMAVTGDPNPVAILNPADSGLPPPVPPLSRVTAFAVPRFHALALAHGVVAREALEQGKPIAHHLQHLVIHGVLHLIGYDHQRDEDAERMEALERELLARLGIPDPYA